MAIKPTRSTGRSAMQKALMRKGLVAPADAARATGFGSSTIYRWLDDGQVEAVHVVNKRYIRAAELLAMVGNDMKDEVRARLRALGVALHDPKEKAVA
jgi:hypothetical protein